MPDMNYGNIKYAIIPVAGLGTRLLPATKAIPKEMMPLVDKPLIHVTIMHVRQGEAKGLAHAIMCAQPIVGKSPFAVLLPDVIIDNAKSDLTKDNLTAMVQRFEESGTAQIMVEKVDHKDVSSYGIVDLQGAQPKPGEDVMIKSIVEKPPVAEAPSDFAVVGRYVLPAEIWPLFKRTPLGAGGEFQLFPGLPLVVGCGNKEGYVKTFIEYALRHPVIGGNIHAFLKELCAAHGDKA